MGQQIQWFPGHMSKTRRLIQQNIKLIDVVVEILDARIPLSGRNSNFDDILRNKPRLIVLNKYDLADKQVTDMWISEYAKKGIRVIPISCSTGYGINKIAPAAKELLKERIDREKDKGMTRTVKIMMVGIPNVGKSTLINRLVGKAKTETGDRPGVTKTQQWVRIREDIELLDTPGLLPPKFENQDLARNLAYTGAIKDEIINTELLSYSLLDYLRDNYSKELCERYKLTDDISNMQGYEILEYIGKKRGFKISGGEVDMERAANIVLDEFRDAKIGNITLEKPL